MSDSKSTETDLQIQKLEQAARKYFGPGYDHPLNLWRLLISTLVAIINEVRSR